MYIVSIELHFFGTIFGSFSVFFFRFCLYFTYMTCWTVSSQLSIYMHLSLVHANNFLAPYLHQFLQWCRLCPFFGVIWGKFALNMVLLLHQNLKILYSLQKQHLLMVLYGTNFGEQHSLQSIKISTYLKPNQHFCHANKVQIQCTF